MINNKVFDNKKEILNLIISELTILRFTPEDPICRQGAPGNNIYFIATGTCTVSVIDEHKTEIDVRDLKEGNYFGEIALLKGCKRTASVRSKNYVTLASLEKKHFNNMIVKFPFVKRNMEAMIKKK